VSLLYVESNNPFKQMWRAQCDDSRCNAFLVTSDRKEAADWDLHHWKEFHGYPVYEEEQA
jgi:hypothetical protein